MSQCQCITKTGTQCKLQASKKKGDDPRFCTRFHQQCTNIYIQYPHHDYRNYQNNNRQNYPGGNGLKKKKSKNIK